MREVHRIRNISCKRQGKLANEMLSEMAALSVWFQGARLSGPWSNSVGGGSDLGAAF
jgi:hypothetical protein